MLFSHFSYVILSNSLKLCAMKKTISPKDALFVTMLTMIIAVGFIGFAQSMKFKSKSQQNLSAQTKEASSKKEIK